MHRELEWSVSKATCLYAHLYMVYRHLYKIIEGTTVAEIYKAFCFFLEIASPDCSGFKKPVALFGVARSTYVGSLFRNTSRVGSGVEIKKTVIFVLIRAEIGPTEKWLLLERE
jgi:hypothetical protein